MSFVIYVVMPDFLASRYICKKYDKVVPKTITRFFEESFMLLQVVGTAVDWPVCMNDIELCYIITPTLLTSLRVSDMAHTSHPGWRGNKAPCRWMAAA